MHSSIRHYVWHLLVGVLLGVGAVLFFQVWHARTALQRALALQRNSASSSQSPFPMLTPFIPDRLQPPTQAAIGNVATVSGEVLKLPRYGSQPEVLREGASIVDGERITTKASSTVQIDFAERVRVVIGPMSSTSFSNLLPSSMLFSQAEGTVTYQLLAAQHETILQPISIRSVNTLLELKNGQVTISIAPSGKELTIDVHSGQAQLAFIDSENTTQVVSLREGEVTVFDVHRKKVTKTQN